MKCKNFKIKKNRTDKRTWLVFFLTIKALCSGLCPFFKEFVISILRQNSLSKNRGNKLFENIVCCLYLFFSPEKN